MSYNYRQRITTLKQWSKDRENHQKEHQLFPSKEIGFSFQIFFDGHVRDFGVLKANLEMSNPRKAPFKERVHHLCDIIKKSGAMYFVLEGIKSTEKDQNDWLKFTSYIAKHCNITHLCCSKDEKLFKEGRASSCFVRELRSVPFQNEHEKNVFDTTQKTKTELVQLTGFDSPSNTIFGDSSSNSWIEEKEEEEETPTKPFLFSKENEIQNEIESESENENEIGWDDTPNHIAENNFSFYSFEGDAVNCFGDSENSNPFFGTRK